MNVGNIAELVILQSIEDLWNEKEISGSARFFMGEGFPLCAELAGLDLHSQNRLLDMVNKAMKPGHGVGKKPQYSLQPLQVR